MRHRTGGVIEPSKPLEAHLRLVDIDEAVEETAPPLHIHLLHVDSCARRALRRDTLARIAPVASSYSERGFIPSGHERSSPFGRAPL